MEIRFLILEVECHVKFKIDLIVWKLTRILFLPNKNMLFKIDLIVWKFRALAEVFKALNV